MNSITKDEKILDPIAWRLLYTHEVEKKLKKILEKEIEKRKKDES